MPQIKLIMNCFQQVKITTEILLLYKYDLFNKISLIYYNGLIQNNITGSRITKCQCMHLPGHAFMQPYIIILFH